MGSGELLGGKALAAEGRVRTAQSCAADPLAAAREFHAAVQRPDAALVLFFCSSTYDLDVLGAELRRLFGDVPLVGCTTAGEIGPAGYRTHSISGVSFPAGSCAAVSARIDRLQEFDAARGQGLVAGLLRRLEAAMPGAGPDNSFAYLLVDGLSVREEAVARHLQNALGTIPMIGGSAGDDLKFERTRVYADGGFHDASAVLTLIGTTLPFRVFKTQHFVYGDERLVVTGADAAQRLVREINGRPAAAEYARLIGVPVAELSPTHFAAAPVVVVIDGAPYVRSIQKANADGSLTFYSAIDEGLVMRLGRGVDMVANLAQTLDAIAAQIGQPQLLLACDCILRKLEMARRGSAPEVEEILQQHHAVGFSTYGEQFGRAHVNQTLTGIALGQGEEGGRG